MNQIIITAQVNDAAEWEKGFRTHGPLFQKQTVRRVRFNVTSENKVVCCFEAEDLDKYLTILNSPETAQAMEYDGVKRETVQVFVLDKEFLP